MELIKNIWNGLEKTDVNSHKQTLETNELVLRSDLTLGRVPDSQSRPNMLMYGTQAFELVK